MHGPRGSLQLAAVPSGPHGTDASRHPRQLRQRRLAPQPALPDLDSAQPWHPVLTPYSKTAQDARSQPLTADIRPPLPPTPSQGGQELSKGLTKGPLTIPRIPGTAPSIFKRSLERDGGRRASSRKRSGCTTI